MKCTNHDGDLFLHRLQHEPTHLPVATDPTEHPVTVFLRARCGRRSAGNVRTPHRRETQRPLHAEVNVGRMAVFRVRSHRTMLDGDRPLRILHEESL